MRVSPEFERQMRGYGMTTAHILYHMPDFRRVLVGNLFHKFFRELVS